MYQNRFVLLLVKSAVRVFSARSSRNGQGQRRIPTSRIILVWFFRSRGTVRIFCVVTFGQAWADVGAARLPTSAVHVAKELVMAGKKMGRIWKDEGFLEDMRARELNLHVAAIKLLFFKTIKEKEIVLCHRGCEHVKSFTYSREENYYCSLAQEKSKQIWKLFVGKVMRLLYWKYNVNKDPEWRDFVKSSLLGSFAELPKFARSQRQT